MPFGRVDIICKTLRTGDNYASDRQNVASLDNESSPILLNSSRTVVLFDKKQNVLATVLTYHSLLKY